MWILLLVFSTRCHPLIYIVRCYNRKPVIHSTLIMVEILLMRTKNKAICVICNAQVKCYINTINLRKHLTSRIRRHDFRNEWIADGADALFCLLSYTLTKARTTLAVFSASAVSLFDDKTQEYHPQLLWVTSLALYRLIWEIYHNITYTAAASSSRQPVKIKV